MKNKAKWQSMNLVTYEYEYYQDGWATQDDVRISIVNNEFDFAYIIDTGQVLSKSDSERLLFYWSIDELYEQIERFVLDQTFEIEYHPELGYPTHFGRPGEDSFWGDIKVF